MECVAHYSPGKTVEVKSPVVLDSSAVSELVE